MLYVKKLIITDETDSVIYKAKTQKAIPALEQALEIIKQKEGDKEVKGILKKFLLDLDKEFKEYFDMRGLK